MTRIRVPDVIPANVQIRVPGTNPGDNVDGVHVRVPDAGAPSGILNIDITPVAAEGATWTVTGPNGFNQVGTGDAQLTGLSSGDYTIDYDDNLIGYIAPAQDTVTVSNDTQSFTGTYTARSTNTSISVDIQTDLGADIGQTWTVRSATGFVTQFVETGAGDGTLTGPLYVGRQYTITYDPEPGYATPPADSWIATEAGSHTFTANYTTQAGYVRPPTPAYGQSPLGMCVWAPAYWEVPFFVNGADQHTRWADITNQGWIGLPRTDHSSDGALLSMANVTSGEAAVAIPVYKNELYHFEWTCSGSVSFYVAPNGCNITGWSGANNVGSGSATFTVSNVTGTAAAWLEIHVTALTGSFRVDKVYADSHSALVNTSAVVIPEVAADYAETGVLRMRDWLFEDETEANNILDVQTHAHSYTRGSVLYLVQLGIDTANQIGRDMWFSFPHMLQPSHLVEVAQLIESGPRPLNPGLSWFMEASNEIWNWDAVYGGYPGGIYFAQQGRILAEAGDPRFSDINPGAGGADYFLAYRYMAIVMKGYSDAIEAVYPTIFSSGRCKRIYSGQEGNTGFTATCLDTDHQDGTRGWDYCDKFAYNPYMFALTSSFGPPFDANAITSCIDFLRNTSIPQRASTAGVMRAALDPYTALKGTRIPLICYESGQHITPDSNIDQAMVQFSHDVNADPRMYQVYKDYFEACMNGGIDEDFVHFSGPRKWGGDGAFGIKNDWREADDISHKWRGMLDWQYERLNP